jgi:SAM-dependent methyltransferase
MKLTLAMRHPQAAPWFETWFDAPDYHRLYSDHDRREAAAFVGALLGRLQPEPGATMLDLGCGAGRPARELAARGFRVTGIDLAASSIREARRHAAPNLRFARGDMRRPFGRARYDFVFNFFTSFGYFDDDAEHERAIGNMAAALRPGGALVIDYLNAASAERRLVADDMKAVGAARYRLTRWSDPRHFYNRIVVDGGAEHLERVRKFGLEDFRRMLSRHSLAIEAVCGDYRLGPYDPVASPRLILIARKPRVAAATSERAAA